MIKKYHLILIVVTSSCSGLFSQTYRPIPLVNDLNEMFLKKVDQGSHNIHTSIKPYNLFELGEFYDSSLVLMYLDSRFATDSWFGRKLLNEDLFQKNDEKYSITINPVFMGSVGKDSRLDTSTVFNNTRGFQVFGRIGNKFSFFTDFYENQSLFPLYVQEWVDDNTRGRRIVPSQGFLRPFNGSLDKYDYAYSTGTITYQPNENFNFQFGHGRNFIGEGYRSLLLSDNSFIYPYFKITTNIWKFKYMNLFTQMQDLSKTVNNVFVKKYTSIHYLSIAINQKLSLGVFEAVTYADETGNRGYDLNYINPIIFYRPIEFALHSTGGNVLMGLNVKYKVSENMTIFGQLLLDEFRSSEIFKFDKWWGLKYGLQIGFKSFDSFGVKGLRLQSEFNFVRPYTYAHRNPLQNYSHYNQALAHPLGSNFLENVTIVSYQRNRFFVNGKFVIAQKGFDEENTNWGGNIFNSQFSIEREYGNVVGQGITSNLSNLNVTTGLLVNPVTNLRLELSYTYRNLNPQMTSSNILGSTTHYFSIGLVNRLSNHYYDF